MGLHPCLESLSALATPRCTHQHLERQTPQPNAPERTLSRNIWSVPLGLWKGLGPMRQQIQGATSPPSVHNGTQQRPRTRITAWEPPEPLEA